MIGLLGGVLLQGLGKMTTDYFQRGQTKAANALAAQMEREAMAKDGLVNAMDTMEKYRRNQQQFMEEQDAAKKALLQQEQVNLREQMKNYGYEDDTDVNQHIVKIREQLRSKGDPRFMNVREMTMKGSGQSGF